MMKLISWNIDPEIVAGTTTRQGGYSQGSYAGLNLGLNVGDDPQKVLANRQLLAETLHTQLDCMISPLQTHSTNLMKVSLADGGRGMYSLDVAPASIDGLYTKDSGLFLLTYHADCIPILLYERKQQLILALHSGWKGNVHEITLKAIRLLIDKENCSPKEMFAYIGPSLGKNRFEAKEDIISLVKEMEIDGSPFYTQKADGNYLLDAKGLAKAQMLLAGIPASQITVSPYCTMERQDLFYSYRADHDCGRNVSFIALKEK